MFVTLFMALGPGGGDTLCSKRDVLELASEIKVLRLLLHH